MPYRLHPISAASIMALEKLVFGGHRNASFEPTSALNGRLDPTHHKVMLAIAGL